MKRAIAGLVVLVCLLSATATFADGDDKATPQLDVGVASGIQGPIDEFGDNYTVPVGVLGQFSINKQLAVGTSWYSTRSRARAH